MALFLTIIYWIFLITAVFVIIFSIPGTFLIVLINLLYQLVDQFDGINWRILFLLLLIAVALELAEFFITAWSSQRFGASKAGTAGAIIGSIIGAIIGTGILPLFGSLIGAFIGAFAGAFFIDLVKTGDLNKSLQSGFGAFTGSIGGKLVKIFGAVGMLMIIAG